MFKSNLVTEINTRGGTKGWIYLAALMSVIFFLLMGKLSKTADIDADTLTLQAAQIMQEAIEVIREYRGAHGLTIDEGIDPNRTGLVGPEFSPLTTTIGHLDAKRTTTNPNMAGLIVRLLFRAGVTKGDTIAIGSSASFPALMVASMAAAQAMALHPRMIISLGASSFGGTDVDFHLLDMVQLLLEKGVLQVPPVAISLGGDADVGRSYDPVLRARLVSEIHQSSIPLFEEPNLKANVKRRSRYYGINNGKNPIKAFINAGGSYANMGTSSLVLKVKPGLNDDVELPPIEQRGMIHTMSFFSVPVIHLLFIKGLVVENGLPWDPIPLPQPRSLSKTPSGNTVKSPVILLIYFITLLIIIILSTRKKQYLITGKLLD